MSEESVTVEQAAVVELARVLDKDPTEFTYRSVTGSVSQLIVVHVPTSEKWEIYINLADSVLELPATSERFVVSAREHDGVYR